LISRIVTDRRTFLSGLMAAATVPAWAQSPPTNPDVVIIGAGAAGLAAAHTLIGHGKSVVVIEAANRIGGRAYTESATFGVPFDHGCSWMAGPRDLPLVKMARDWEFTLHDHSSASEAVYKDGRRINAAERRQYDAAYTAIDSALSATGEADKDVSAASVVPKDLPFSGIPQTWIGPMDWGVDFDDLSTMDWWMSNDAEVYFLVKEGFGALVERYGQGLPVQLNTPATAIDWSGEGVAVDTPAGTIRAKACIVTVSTGVLAANYIRFAPELPDATQDAIANLPMGLLAKVALQFDGERFGLIPNQWMSYWVPEPMPANACYFLSFPFGFDMMIGFVGGAFGWDLSGAGEAAAVDFALGELEKQLGSDVRRHFVKGYFTDWASNPTTLGGYAAARPGQFAARSDLGRPVADRIYFAGEAVSEGWVALCSGAYLSGEVVANEVAAVISSGAN